MMRRPPRLSRGRVVAALAVLTALTTLIAGSFLLNRAPAGSAPASRTVADLPHKFAPASSPPATLPSTPTPAPSAAPSRRPIAHPSAAPTPTPTPCIGPALTSQIDVKPNTTYCGGRATSQILLAAGDTWTGGEVTGVVTGRQRAAVECPSNCALIGMNVHDNPRAFAGIGVAPGKKFQVIIWGGRVTGTGALGIGGGGTTGMTISGVQIDHNGSTADCNFEGGGFKGGAVHQLHFFGNDVHDNGCTGVWLDINSSNNEIDHNRVVNNAHEGIFYEISQAAVIHDNILSGNGFQTNGTSCAWLWGGGITIASSSDVEVYGNTLTSNCNGITGTQQDRRDSMPPAHLLTNVKVHDNWIGGGGKTGVVADNGADLSTRAISLVKNSFSSGAVLCGFAC